jgi:hypothetical protein
MIQEVSNKMFAEFTSNLRVRLGQERAPAEAQTATPEAQPIKALPLLLSVVQEPIVRVFRRIFKGSDYL